jgi:hypothetical protein
MIRELALISCWLQYYCRRINAAAIDIVVAARIDVGNSGSKGSSIDHIVYLFTRDCLCFVQ